MTTHRGAGIYTRSRFASAALATSKPDAVTLSKIFGAGRRPFGATVDRAESHDSRALGVTRGRCDRTGTRTEGVDGAKRRWRARPAQGAPEVQLCSVRRARRSPPAALPDGVPVSGPPRGRPRRLLQQAQEGTFQVTCPARPWRNLSDVA